LAFSSRRVIELIIISALLYPEAEISRVAANERTRGRGKHEHTHIIGFGSRREEPHGTRGGLVSPAGSAVGSGRIEGGGQMVGGRLSWAGLLKWSLSYVDGAGPSGAVR